MYTGGIRGVIWSGRNVAPRSMLARILWGLCDDWLHLMKNTTAVDDLKVAHVCGDGVLKVAAAGLHG
jgi:hypothetical protein